MSDDGNTLEVIEGGLSEPPCESVGITSSCGNVFQDLGLDPDTMINSPPHYKQGDVEAIEIIEHVVKAYPDPVIGGSVWQVLKYLIRAPHKGALEEDLKKANWYLRRAIEHAK